MALSIEKMNVSLSKEYYSFCLEKTQLWYGHAITFIKNLPEQMNQDQRIFLACYLGMNVLFAGIAKIVSSQIGKIFAKDSTLKEDQKLEKHAFLNCISLCIIYYGNSTFNRLASANLKRLHLFAMTIGVFCFHKLIESDKKQRRRKPRENPKKQSSTKKSDDKKKLSPVPEETGSRGVSPDPNEPKNPFLERKTPLAALPTHHEESLPPQPQPKLSKSESGERQYSDTSPGRVTPPHVSATPPPPISIAPSDPEAIVLWSGPLPAAIPVGGEGSTPVQQRTFLPQLSGSGMKRLVLELQNEPAVLTPREEGQPPAKKDKESPPQLEPGQA